MHEVGVNAAASHAPQSNTQLAVAHCGAGRCSQAAFGMIGRTT
jgi:hypothetical protein